MSNVSFTSMTVDKVVMYQEDTKANGKMYILKVRFSILFLKVDG